MKFIFQRLFIAALLTYLGVYQLHAQCTANTTITTQNQGMAEVLTCPYDGRNDVVVFESDAPAGENYVYVLTNDADIVLDYRSHPSINFERARFSPFRVYGLSYSGGLTIKRGTTLQNGQLSTDCYALSSNFITIRASVPAAGTVSTIQGASSLDLCSSDDNLIQLTRRVVDGASYAYFAVNSAGVIVAYTGGTVLDFSELENDQYQIYGVAYRGAILDVVGDTFIDTYLASDCFGISSNTVRINLADLEGGTISSNVDAAVIDACAADTPVQFSTTQNTNNYAYLIINESGRIAAIVDDEEVLNTALLSTGTYEVVGLAYTEELTATVGTTLSGNALATGCYDLSDNRLALQKTSLTNSSISFNQGLTTLSYCSSADLTLNFEVVEEAQIIYAFTDDTGRITEISNNTQLTLDSINTRIYGVAYTGNLTLMAGQNINTAQLSDNCFERSSNFIDVRFQQPEAGDVQLSSGGESFYACPEQFGQLQLGITNDGANSALYTYLLLDENDIIQNLSTTGNFQFTEAMAGTYSVQGVAHATPLSLSIGDVFNDDADLSTICYDLSDNRVEIVWQAPSGGRIRTLNDETSVAICAEATNKRIDLQVEEALGGNYIYLLTDRAGTILGYNIRGFDLANFEGTDFSIYGLSFVGMYSEEVGTNIADARLSNACHALTETPILVNAYEAEETLVATTDLSPTVDLCIGSAEAATLEVTNTGSQDSYLYLLTDDQDRLVDVFRTNELGGSVSRSMRLWGASASGTVTIQKGENVTLTAVTDACYQLSTNFVTISTTVLSNTLISTFQNEENVSICYGDGVSDYIGFYTEERTASLYSYVITDANNRVIRVIRGNINDFEGAGPSVSRVWGINYTGDLLLRPGQDLLNTTIASGCAALSANFVAINRVQLDAGVISMKDGDDELQLCTTVGTPQIYELSNTSTSEATYTYIITDANDVVLSITQRDRIDFGSFEGDELKVYGIAHVAPLSVRRGLPLQTQVIADGCYDIATNQLTVSRFMIDAGQVTTASGSDQAVICSAGASSAITAFANTGSISADYQYIITDETGLIVALPNGSAFDFASLPEANYDVWGLAYSGSLAIEVGDEFDAQAIFSDACYSLTQQAVRVTQSTPTAQRITTMDGQTSAVTYVGNGTPDVVEFTLPESVGNTLLVITNTNNVVVGLSTEGSYDFDPLSIGFYRVYGVAYAGTITIQVGDRYNQLNVVEGCSAATANFVQIICAPGGRGQRPAYDNDGGVVRVYPNPVDAEFTLEFEQAQHSTQTLIRIVDVNGREVYHQVLTPAVGFQHERINIEQLATGTYWLQVESNGQLLDTQPLLKQ